MKHLAISHTITPEGWMPKPSNNAYNFLDWATKYFYWELWIRKDIDSPEDYAIGLTNSINKQLSRTA